MKLFLWYSAQYTNPRDLCERAAEKEIKRFDALLFCSETCLYVYVCESNTKQTKNAAKQNNIDTTRQKLIRIAHIRVYVAGSMHFLYNDKKGAPNKRPEWFI